MRTLAEIEAEAALLAPEEKEELLRFLAMSLRKERPRPRPRIYSQQELTAMLAEDELDGQHLRRGN